MSIILILQLMMLFIALMHLFINNNVISNIWIVGSIIIGATQNLNTVI